jgi:hypothetical protein
MRSTEDAREHGLFHTWFVQYNPLYLVSAACVLVGVYLVSEGLSEEVGLRAELWLTAITELYQVLLIAGAAILYRIGQRRPAVMLALLEVTYLVDLTFQNGVAAHLGLLGVVASVGWAVFTVVKIRALAWALRLKLSRSMVVVSGVGAVLIAALPHVLIRSFFAPQTMAALVGCAVFALGAVRLWGTQEVASSDEHGLSKWGQTVLRRAVTGTWYIWGALFVGHMLWWSFEFDVYVLPPVLTAVGLLAAARTRSEWAVWIAATIAIVVNAWLMPGVVSGVALMAGVVFGLRGWLGNPAGDEQVELPPVLDRHPYRTADELSAPARFWRRVPGPPRLYVGAALCVYLSIWTLGWSAGPWPEHRLWLDLVLSAALLGLLLGHRVRLAILPLVLVHLHHMVQARLVSAPATKLHWGIGLLVAGFLLLNIGVVLNYVFRHRTGGGGGSG